MINLFHRLFILALLIASFAGTAAAQDIDLEEEKIQVKVAFKGNSEQLVVAVNGMCCRSCAIGIGRKVCKLDFVDTKTLPKGVKVDRKTGLLTVAVKSGEEMDFVSLAKAIRDAGYDPVRIYQQLDDGTLNVTDVPRDS